MTDPKTPAGESPEEDGSMEDVLASIRRILEDGTPDHPAAIHPDPAPPESTRPVAVTEPAMTPPDSVKAPESFKNPVEPPVEDVFDLDAAMLIEEHTHVADAKAPEPATDPHAPLLTPQTQSTASASLGELVRKLTERRTAVYKEGPTLEDLVRDEMRPMLKAWLDANIAPMVERLVREEIERVVRLAVD